MEYFQLKDWRLKDITKFMIIWKDKRMNIDYHMYILYRQHEYIRETRE